ncbi:MAG: hypothetical protein C7N14_07605 [Bacteroidetes bacterium]|nr:MAG: hypothetical protein C7N14_07605 [Bacteroidota bacterium]
MLPLLDPSDDATAVPLDSVQQDFSDLTTSATAVSVEAVMVEAVLSTLEQLVFVLVSLQHAFLFAVATTSLEGLVSFDGFSCADTPAPNTTKLRVSMNFFMIFTFKHLKANKNLL